MRYLTLLKLASIEPPPWRGFARDPIRWLALWLAWLICIGAVVALIV